MTEILHLLRPYKFTRVIPTPEGIEIRYQDQSQKFTHCPTVEEILEAIEELIPEPPQSIRLKNEPKDFQIFERAECTSNNTVYRQAKTGNEITLEQLHALRTPWEPVEA